MDAKITRRAVLGTVITGLVAGPFIIRSLHRRKHLPDVGRAEMKRQWDALLKEMIPDVKSTENSHPILCKLKPVPYELPYAVLYPIFHETQKEPRDVPDIFLHRSGRLSVKTLGTETVLMGKEIDSVAVAPGKNRPFPLETWIMSMKDSTPVPMEYSNGQLVALDWNQVPDQILQQMNLYSGFATDAPARPLTVGDTWTVEGVLGGEFVGKVTRRYLGEFLLNGQPVIQVNTKQDMGYEDMVAQSKDILFQVKNQQLRDRLRNEIESAQNMKNRIIVENNSYFDVDTGVLAFRQYEKRIFQAGHSIPVLFETSFTTVKTQA